MPDSQLLKLCTICNSVRKMDSSRILSCIYIYMYIYTRAVFAGGFLRIIGEGLLGLSSQLWLETGAGADGLVFSRNNSCLMLGGLTSFKNIHTRQAVISTLLGLMGFCLCHVWFASYIPLCVYTDILPNPPCAPSQELLSHFTDKRTEEEGLCMRLLWPLW